jgi:hypothetical protein
MLTQEILKQRLHYDPLTGLFTWLVSNNSSRSNGEVAGSLNGAGYIQIRINKKFYLAHRLAFLFMNGSLPKGQVDHINHVKTCNAWANLRDVSELINHQNISKDMRNKTGVTGVKYRHNQDRFIARIGVNKTDVYLGSFKNLDDAVIARKHAEKHYGFHVNHGAEQKQKWHSNLLIEARPDARKC